MVVESVEGLSGGEILAVVESVHRERVAGDATIFRCALEFARIHNGDAADGGGRALPGLERAVRLGGSGTPLVMEFAAAEFGARMQMGTVAARYYLADALDVYLRFPRIAARVDAGEVKVAYARLVARETRHLSVEAAAHVDAAMADYADGSLPWSRFCARLEGKIIEADPEEAARREEAAASAQFARATRSTEHGMRGFYLRAPGAVVARFDATVAYLAEALRVLGDTDDEDRRRVKACLVMANPTQAVELMATFAAHRAAHTDQQLPLPDDRGPGQRGEAPDDGPDDGPDDSTDPSDGSDESDGTATGPCRSCGAGPAARAGEPVIEPRRFDPVGLPGWLTRLVRGPDAGQRPDGAPGDRAGPGGEGFRFDWSALLPDVSLYLHVSGDTVDRDAGGVVRWEGAGPVSWQYVRERIAPYQSFTIRPVLDLAGQVAVDAYEIPDRHRRAVLLRTPADCFPFSSTVACASSGGIDVDHTEAYRDASAGGKRGQSRMGNYSPLGRFHHRVKTHGRWTLKQPYDGIYVWRDPHGAIYLVDHTGTHAVGRTSDQVEAGGAGDGLHRPLRSSDIEIELHEATHPIDYSPSHAA